MRTVHLVLLRTETVFHNGGEVKLPEYRVLLSGREVGRVSREMVTRERRAKGQRYVLARWKSPGWCYRTIGGYRRFECYSRRNGVERLLRDSGVDFFEATELAKAAKIKKPSKEDKQ